MIRGLKEKIVNAYYKYMVDIAVVLGADKKRAEKELKEMLNFEIALAKVCLKKNEKKFLLIEFLNQFRRFLYQKRNEEIQAFFTIYFQ